MEGDHKKRECPAAGVRRGTASLFIGSSYLSFSTSFYCVWLSRVCFLVVGLVAIFFGGRVYIFYIFSRSCAPWLFPLLETICVIKTPFSFLSSSPLPVSASMPQHVSPRFQRNRMGNGDAGHPWPSSHFLFFRSTLDLILLFASSPLPVRCAPGMLVSAFFLFPS